MSDQTAGLGLGHGVVQRGDSLAGWLAGVFSLSKTNNGHVTGRVLCLRTNQIEPTSKPEKGGVEKARIRLARLDERELERNS
jgi:hypothetical protein